MLKKILNQLLWVAVLGAIFLLGVALLDAFIGLSEFIDLLLHSIVFKILLIVALWATAILITSLSKRKPVGWIS